MNVRKLLIKQDGAALPVAMAMLLIVSLLVALIASNAVQSTDNASDDRHSKRALAAAEAGLAVATYRLTKLKPPANMCFTNTAAGVAKAGSPPECPGLTESGGNGTQYRYYVTEVGGGVAAGCGTALQRCITVEGIVDGKVLRRLQSSVESASVPGGPYQGLLGLDGITLKNNANVDGSMASNGLIKYDNSLNMTGDFELGGPPPCSPQPSPAPPPSQVTCNANPWSLALDPVEFEAAENINNNLTPGNISPAGVYDNARRELDWDSGIVTLKPGTYSFCNIKNKNSAEIRINPAGKVTIYLDAPFRTGSSCPGGTGKWEAENDLHVNYPPGASAAQLAANAANLDLKVWGTGSGANMDINFKNKLWFAGVIHAPNSAFEAKNNAEIVGSVTAKVIEFKNNLEFTYPNATLGGGGTTGTYNRKGWRECREKQPTPGDPESC